MLLLDLPPGAERTVQLAQLFGSRAAFVLVTVPSAVSRQVVARSLDALLGDSATPGGQGRVLGYVENMAGYWCRDCGAVRPLFPVAPPLPLPCLAAIPFDPELAAACDQGAPAPLTGAASAALREAARRLLAILEGPP